MCKSHVSCPQLIHHAQCVQTAVNAVPSLHSDHASNLASLQCVRDTLSVGDKHEIIRVGVGQSAYHVNLLDCQSDGVLVLVVTTYVCCPELRSYDYMFKIN